MVIRDVELSARARKQLRKVPKHVADISCSRGSEPWRRKDWKKSASFRATTMNRSRENAKGSARFDSAARTELSTRLWDRTFHSCPSKKFPSMITEEHKSMASKSSAMRFLEKITGGPLTFGRMLQSIRMGEEKSLDVFAQLLDISRTNLSDIEHGRRGVSVERAARWAELLGYSQTQFVRLALQAQLDKAGLELYAQVTRAPQSPDTPRSVKPRKRTRARSRVVTAETGKRRKVA